MNSQSIITGCQECERREKACWYGEWPAEIGIPLENRKYSEECMHGWFQPNTRITITCDN